MRTKCLNLGRIPRDFLIFEEIYDIRCFQVRFGSVRIIIMMIIIIVVVVVVVVVVGSYGAFKEFSIRLQ